MATCVGPRPTTPMACTKKRRAASMSRCSLSSVRWRLQYTLSLRDLATMFLGRGIVITHEAARAWEAGDPRAGGAPLLAERLRGEEGGVDLELASGVEAGVEALEAHALQLAVDGLDGGAADVRSVQAGAALHGPHRSGRKGR